MRNDYLFDVPRDKLAIWAALGVAAWIVVALVVYGLWIAIESLS